MLVKVERGISVGHRRGGGLITEKVVVFLRKESGEDNGRRNRNGTQGVPRRRSTKGFAGLQTKSGSVYVINK